MQRVVGRLYGLTKLVLDGDPSARPHSTEQRVGDALDRKTWAGEVCWRVEVETGPKSSKGRPFRYPGSWTLVRNLFGVPVVFLSWLSISGFIPGLISTGDHPESTDTTG